MDPRFERVVRCACGARADYDPAAECCGRCAVRKRVDDGDLATAHAIAAECGISATTVRRFARDEAERSARAEQRAALEQRRAVAVPPPPRVPALPVFATARERELFVPERISCGEDSDPTRDTVRPPRAA